MSEISSDSPDPPENLTRRTFSQRLLLGITAVVGLLATVAFAIPFVGYLLGAARKIPVRWVNLGPIDDEKFPKDQTRLVTFDNPLGEKWDGMTAHTGVYVRNLGKDRGNRDQFRIFAVNCAHLGCPVSWFPQSGLFMCPCHGGVYYENGERASGPPPRGLFECVWRVRAGSLEVQAPHFPTLHNTLKDEG
ncbi:MAG: Rieske 2Fe-2S domain-containing protein [Planctomycetes bacterium]|nr:Rieske 2Fe-2S domain-containing protein [Planctomycetota bacterium]